jgi:hypothetical protein
MKSLTKEIFNLINEIHKNKAQIYEYINTTRHQHKLIKDLNIWNQICSSLDVLDDTILSIEDYLKSKFPSKAGLKYIYTYGILQSLFIQQDSVRNLSEAFSVSFKYCETLKRIRDIRNSSIGHRQKQDKNKNVYYNYISRISLDKECFTLQQANVNQPNDVFAEINIFNLIKEQLRELNVLLKNISQKLEKR